ATRCVSRRAISASATTGSISRRVTSAADARRCASARATPAAADAAPFRRPSTSLRVSSSVARARSSAISYGRGAMTESRSPSWTGWLSRTWSWTMCPLTWGAMPTKLARTVASSVCGRVSHWSSVTATAMTAAATIATPSSRPRMRRKPGSGGTDSSVMASHPEERHPEPEGDENGQARVPQRRRAHVRIDPGADEEPSREQGHHDADHGAQHPRWEEGADDVDLRSHGVSPPLALASRRLVAHRLARVEGERRGRVEQLKLGFERDEPGTAELPASGQELDEIPEPQAIGLQHGLV